jgi:hypothetical protein
MMKLANWIVAVALIAVSGVAGAQDRYYIQTGAFPTIGDISATGFFQTSGIGTDTVTGFDLTLSSGRQSVTLCSSSLFGCTVNDFIPGQMGIVDTGTQLVCTANCLFYDDEVGINFPTGFVFVGGSLGQGETEQYRVGGYQNTAVVAAPIRGFVIAAQKPTSAPEIDPASASSGLTLLLGGLAVLGDRKRRTIAA